MGIVVVALFAANANGIPVTTIRSTLMRTRSATSAESRSFFCSPNRDSMVTFVPSVQPSLLSSFRKVSKRTAVPAAVLGSTKPMRGIFVGCCASACAHRECNDDCKEPHPFSSAGPLLDFRFSIIGPKASKIASRFSHAFVFPQSKIGNLKSKMSSYDPIGSNQNIRTNRLRRSAWQL